MAGDLERVAGDVERVAGAGRDILPCGVIKKVISIAFQAESGATIRN